MTNESDAISVKTFQRAAASISKIGYMDGAADGQESTFQSSFDKGYTLGYSFGLELGINEALHSVQPSTHPKELLQDPRNINCQICLNNTLVRENVANLYNFQRETNDRLYKSNNINYKTED